MKRFVRSLLVALAVFACAIPTPAPAEECVLNSVRRLHRAQGEVWKSKARFRFAVWGRGAGKTHEAVAEILGAVTTDPRARAQGHGFLVLYVAPTRDMARDLVWEWLLDELPPEFIRKTNHTRLEIELTWGPKIKLVGADKLRRARGLSVNFMVVDEFAQMRDGIWATLRPTLRTPLDRALIITTPFGPNHAWELWQKVQAFKGRGWETWQKPTTCNPYHDPAILEEARHVLSLADYEQEYEAKFMALRGAIYGDFAIGPDRNVPDAPIAINADRELFIGQDYNGGLYSSVLCQTSGEKGLDAVDEVVTRSTLYAHREALKERVLGYGYKPRELRDRVWVIADCSGDYNRTSKADSSDNEVMRDVFHVTGRSKNPPVNERILTVQALVRNAHGDVRLRVSPRCKELITCLLNQTWNRWGRPDKTRGLDHLPDALGYVSDWIYPIDRTHGAYSRAA